MPGDRPAYRVVIVTMDSHTAGPAARVQERLAQDFPGLTVSVHAAAEWAENPETLLATRAAVAAGDLIIANMLFLDEHVRAILPDLQARRDGCDAMLCCMSAGEVTKLTKLGRFDMSKEATGALAMLKRLRGKPGAGASSSSGAGQMRMLRRLPKMMKFIPGTAQDVRTYFLALQYWLAGSDEIVARYLGKEPSWRRRPS